MRPSRPRTIKLGNTLAAHTAPIERVDLRSLPGDMAQPCQDEVPDATLRVAGLQAVMNPARSHRAVRLIYLTAQLDGQTHHRRTGESGIHEAAPWGSNTPNLACIAALYACCSCAAHGS